MKKRHVRIALGLLAAALVCGCATAPHGMQTALLGDIRLPGGVTENPIGSKVGTAKARYILGIIADGDCSIARAARSKNITKVGSVDYHVMTVLWGAYIECTTIVTGE